MYNYKELMQEDFSFAYFLLSVAADALGEAQVFQTGEFEDIFQTKADGLISEGEITLREKNKESYSCPEEDDFVGQAEVLYRIFPNGSVERGLGKLVKGYFEDYNFIPE